MKGQWDVAGRVGEIPGGHRAGRSHRGRQPRDVVDLAGRVVDPGQQRERETVAVLVDRRLQVLGPDDRLAGAWPHDDQVRRWIAAVRTEERIRPRSDRMGRSVHR